MNYGCSSCGECCKRIGANIEKLRALGFPYGVQNDGRSCEMLTDDGKCKVYRNRPDICNVDKQYYLNPANKGKTKKEVFLNEAKICNSWIREANLDKKYLIDESQYK